MGSATPGSYGAVTEVYGEGLRLPPLRLASRGVLSSDLEKVILANVRTLSLPGAEVRSGKAERVIAGAPPSTPYDLVFLDPPYAVTDGELREILVTLSSEGWLDEDVIVTVERSTRGGAFTWPEGFEGLRERRYGEATLWYGRAADGADKGAGL